MLDYKFLLFSTLLVFSFTACGSGGTSQNEVPQDDLQQDVNQSDENLSDMNQSENINYEIIGSYNPNTAGANGTHYIRDIALSSDGETLFVLDGYSTDSSGSTLLSLNVQDPNSIQNLDTYSFNLGYTSSIKLSHDNTRAYLADASQGVKIIDTSDPEKLKLLHSVSTDNYVHDIALSQDNKSVYMAHAYNAGMTVLDVNSSDELVHRATLELDDTLYCIKLSEDNSLAFLLSSNLHIVDINDSDNPLLVSDFNTSNYASDIVLSSNGNTAFIADSESGLQIVDVSNASNPILIASLQTNENNDSLSRAMGIALSSDDKTVYIAQESIGLQIVDVSALLEPKVIGTVDTSGYALRVVISEDGKKAYVADESGGVKIISIK